MGFNINCKDCLYCKMLEVEWSKEKGYFAPYCVYFENVLLDIDTNIDCLIYKPR